MSKEAAEQTVPVRKEELVLVSGGGSGGVDETRSPSFSQGGVAGQAGAGAGSRARAGAVFVGCGEVMESEDEEDGVQGSDGDGVTPGHLSLPALVVAMRRIGSSTGSVATRLRTAKGEEGRAARMWNKRSKEEKGGEEEGEEEEEEAFDGDGLAIGKQATEDLRGGATVEGARGVEGGGGGAEVAEGEVVEGGSGA